jgi:hypothetical protein
VEDGDPIAGQECPNCGVVLRYLGHLDGGSADGIRFNVVLWECRNCGGRYSATTDLTDAKAPRAGRPKAVAGGHLLARLIFSRRRFYIA